jgi:aspartyl/asparaginyl beta-hydroxylase (cupin superfamily)
MTAASAHVAEPWYNIFGGRYDRGEPSFYDPKDFPWAKVLEDNVDVMREEMTALVATDQSRLKPYFINRGMSFPPRHWKTMGLFFWNFRMHRNCRRCPKTTKILESIPHLTAASLSVLEAKANINPHQGDTDAIVRCHLGLVVPAGLPDCGFQVGKEVRPWEEGKVLIFCDAQTHLAWNQSDRRRMIMIFDVVRPEYQDQTNTICSHVLASTLLQMLYQDVAWLNRTPGWMKQALYLASRMMIRVILPIQRRARFL